MSDPCGIVDTIQSNLPTIDSVAAVACIGATDTTIGTTLTDGDAEDDGSSSPKAGSANDKPFDEDASKGKETESKPKKRGGLLRKWTKRATEKDPEEKEDEKEEEPPKMDPISDLSDPSRKICVVTTAGLPWRTGTAVNPLARALYLTRGRPKHAVTLMIPWLEARDEQAKVYGKNVFDTPEEQEAWTRNYCRERILNSTDEKVTAEANKNEDDQSNDESNDDEVDKLQIRFYPAKYHTSFGSIFASVDICALVPQEEADIAILEEPEHLTWFRSLPPSSISSATTVATSAMESMMDNDSSCGACAVDGDEKKDSNEEGKENEDTTSELEELKKLEEQAIIGWTAKFSYVVGILHTNYSAYMRQYGLGASIVTSNALQALSSVCVRAYTHRLIRLSDTLPELDKPKEITCNVHGVRPEFFVIEEKEVEEETCGDGVVATKADPLLSEIEKPQPDSASEKTDDEGTEQTSISSKMEESDEGNAETIDISAGDISAAIEEDEKFRPEPVYFIGKVIWAKGFDKLLEIEDLYRKETGEYFPIDVYGSGSDFEAISRAFLGRSGLAKKAASSGSVKSLADLSQSGERSKSPDSEQPSPKDQTAALLFSREGNLRGQLDDLQTVPSNELVVEVQTCETPMNADTPNDAKKYPKQIIGQLGEKTKETGTGVTKAISKLSEKISNLGFRSLYSEENDDSETSYDCNATAETGSSLASKFKFDPPKSRYELRRHSIPARFLGVKDHALLRDIPEHKIFVNLSITEVLCTTTAEALAMGKFVVIPEHPSNTFFLQFPNCLAYKAKKECVEKIKFALENVPTPLSPEDRHKLTWEGANKRLYESSLMTEAEAEERNKKTGDFARLHMDTMKTGAFFQGLWSRGTHKKPMIKEEQPEEKETTETKETSLIGICSPKKKA
eukprot:CAMPEP_0116123484 /NCGR_PEP_ID=MMETSP0329-20121206/4775_1 /TAXON_ID=697910 /ORGANISM="Pseudo-nitzschia arenysensis, Strain B593" /LENGTH=907 /DNA_ID=CAMNT_0003617407 /DNA_START=110 /DNA_END=2833 /DNA_ORIENTATION=+